MVDTLELLKRYDIDDGTHSGDAHLRVLFKNIYYIFWPNIRVIKCKQILYTKQVDKMWLNYQPPIILML